ncbi:MAG: TolC family protein [Fibrobacteraceae bacterium]|nr:TolC family protein [Fibrobacteraceae bacterium]
MPRQIAISAAFAATIALGLATESFAGQTYTREEAVNIAMEKSSAIKSAEEELVSANSKITSGYGNALPTIDLDATVTRIFGLDDVKKSSDVSDAASYYASQETADGNGVSHPNANAFDTEVIGPALDGISNALASQGYRWQSSVGITATQVLYAQGKVGTGIEIAKAYKRQKEVSLDNEKSKVRYDVENAFDQLIVMDSSVAILEASIALTQSNIDFVTQSYQSGMVGELDLIRAKLQLDELNSQLETLQKQRVLARNNLLNTMGLEFDADVQFEGTLRNPENEFTYPDTSMSNVKKRRKELVMLEIGEEMLSKNIDIEEGGYKPTVVLGGTIKYSNNQNEFYKWDAPDWDKNINKIAFLKVTMNLFNGMKTRESVVQAKSSLRSTQIQKETAERGFRLEIESCARTLDNAQTQLVLKKNSIELAQKNYDMTEAAYKIGQETQLNLLSANMSLRNAKMNYLNAVLDWNKALNALLKATGEY